MGKNIDQMFNNTQLYVNEIFTHQIQAIVLCKHLTFIIIGVPEIRWLTFGLQVIFKLVNRSTWRVPQKLAFALFSFIEASSHKTCSMKEYHQMWFAAGQHLQHLLMDAEIMVQVC